MLQKHAQVVFVDAVEDGARAAMALNLQNELDLVFERFTAQLLLRS